MSEMLQKITVLILQCRSSVGGVRRVSFLKVKASTSAWAKSCSSSQAALGDDAELSASDMLLATVLVLRQAYS